MMSVLHKTVMSNERYKVVIITEDTGQVHKELTEGGYEYCKDFMRWGFKSHEFAQMDESLTLDMVSCTTGRFASYSL